MAKRVWSFKRHGAIRTPKLAAELTECGWCPCGMADG